jgi:hypothetical protein
LVVAWPIPKGLVGIGPWSAFPITSGITGIDLTKIVYSRLRK